MLELAVIDAVGWYWHEAKMKSGSNWGHAEAVELGWIQLDTQRQIHEATMVFSFLNGLAPDYLCSKFTDLSNLSTYCTV